MDKVKNTISKIESFQGTDEQKDVRQSKDMLSSYGRINSLDNLEKEATRIV